MKDDRQIEIVAEGNETDDFWGFLGGKGEYAKVDTAGELEIAEARCFSAQTKLSVRCRRNLQFLPRT